MIHIRLVAWLCITLAPSGFAMPLQVKTGEDLWRIRPPVPLAQALVAADKALGRDAGRYYCVSASVIPIIFIKPGVGAIVKPGQVKWVLFYSTTAGQRKTVQVTPDGKATIERKQDGDDAYTTGQLVNVSPIGAKPGPPPRRATLLGHQGGAK